VTGVQTWLFRSCGSREGIEVSALRLCLSARLIVNALRHPNQGEIIIADALTVLAKTAWLIHSTEPHHVKSNL
jgi:lambda repressor-like predicted transcriptional regulator